MRTILFATFGFSALLLLAGCATPEQPKVADMLPPLHNLPVVTKSPLNAGVYFSPQFAAERRLWVFGPGPGMVWPVGAASVQLFDHLFGMAFAQTTRVHALTPDAIARAGVDLAISPTLEYFSMRDGFDTDGPSSRWRVTYRLTLYNRAGVPVASWTVTGDDPEGGAKNDLNKAAREFLTGFERHAGPALNAMAGDRPANATAIDPSEVVVTAQPTALKGLDQQVADALRRGGVVPILIRARSTSGSGLTVRGSDMRLRLPNGGTIEPSSASALLGNLFKRDTSHLFWGGGILGALAILGSAAEHTSQREQRARETAAVSKEILADRKLKEGKEESGVLLFRVPGGAQSARDATLTVWIVDTAAANGVQLDVPLTGAPGAVARAPSVATPKPAVEPERVVAPKPVATASTAPVSRATVPPPGPSKSPPAGVGGLQQGDRWEYAFVDSRNGRPTSRRFEIEQVDRGSIVERVELEDGKRLTASHHRGAYLSMVGGMQLAPYYFAFQPDAATSPIGDVKAEGGDACASRPDVGYSYQLTYDCEIQADFLGIEPVTVPAGTFRAHAVRITVDAQAWGGHNAHRFNLINARFWISAKAGRIVKAVITHEADPPWTETMELVSYRTGDRMTGSRPTAVSR